MKVCTDACLFGAWVADKTEKREPAPKNILDIGAGTGLLSLMLAQKCDAVIDSIEINAEAAIQATTNIKTSPWNNRIRLKQIALQEFNPKIKYEIIISNPPFFELDLRSENDEKNAAKHDSTLKFEELVSFIKEHLSITGMAAVLIPFTRYEYFVSLLKKTGLFIQESMLVKQSTRHAPFRWMLMFSHNEIINPEVKKLAIKDSDGNYSEEFTLLLKDYYLKL